MNDTRAALVDYRIGFKPGGVLPGAFGGTIPGSGQQLRAVVPLKDHPDPRRLDLRATLRDPLHRLWVRDFLQNTALKVVVLADLSASMSYRGTYDKYRQLRQISVTLAHSAFHGGDAFGFFAADEKPRVELALPPRVNRGAADWIVRRLDETVPSGGSARGLLDLQAQLPRRHALVFVISDFNWPDADHAALFKGLVQHEVVPVVLWDPSEFERLPRRGIAALQDIETGERRFVWLRPSLIEAARSASASRENRLRNACRRAGRVPYFVRKSFDPLNMTNHFMGGSNT